MNSCCIAAAVRFYTLYHSYHSPTAPAGKLTDPYGRLITSSLKCRILTRVTENATNGFIWAHIEPSCSVIAACLPTYGPFFINSRYSLGGLLSSLRSFMSLGSRSPSSREEGLISDPKSSGQDLELSNGRNAWVKLDAGGNNVEIRGVSRNTSESDLEEHSAMPPRIQVRREFGSEVDVV